MNRDVETEEEFVNRFVLPDRRDRWRLMLAVPKKRRKLLGRLNHNFDCVKDRAKRIPSNLQSCEGLLALLKEHGIGVYETAYIISDSPELDCGRFPITEALDKCLFIDWGTIVCFQRGELAYFKPESPGEGFLFHRS